MSILRAAETYIASGWPVLVIKRGEKRPVNRAWTEQANVLGDFSEDTNIGVRLGNGIVDIDLDSDEARVVGQMLLPSNTRIHGRPGKPTSHYWFQTDPKFGEYKSFTDLDGKLVHCELRAASTHQTVLPPSVHPSGDTLSWETDHPLLFLEPPTIQKLVASVATGALLARHWPEGSRHTMATHVAGLLSRLGEDAETIPRIVRAIAVAAKDNEPGDRERAARDTIAKLAKGETKITGGPAMAKLLGATGAEILARINDWYGRNDCSEVDKLNEKHFVVQIGHDMVVGCEDAERPMVFLSFNGFRQLYSNRPVEKKTLGEFWLSHPNRRQYGGVVFAPPPLKARDDDYNMWKGFACDPLDGPLSTVPIERFLEHVRLVICRKNDKHYEYVIDLLAATVQNPGTPTGKVLAMRGKQGVGKSIFMTGFGSLFGRHYTVVSNRGHIVGNFNAHLSGKVVVFADEAMWGGDRQSAGTWKRLVTEKTVMVERKGIDAIEEPNCIHLFMATNEDWVAPGERERRLVALDVDDTARPRSYYEALVAEIEGPLFQATLLTFLQRRDISAGLWRESLDTRALREQQEFSGGAVQQWWSLKLADGFVMPEEGSWPDTIIMQDAYQAYLDEMHTLGKHRDLGTRMMFTRTLKKYLPKECQESTRLVRVPVNGRYLSEKRVPRRAILIPSLAACRRYFDERLNTTEKWLSPDTEDAMLPMEVLEEGPF